MSSLVLELQRDVSNSEMSVTDLLRKAYIIARKLKIPEFEKWINYELNGYTCEYEEIPDYRKILGELRGWNPYNGWIPVLIDEKQLAEVVLNRRLNDSITHLETLACKGSETLSLPFPNENRKLLAKWMEIDTNYQTFFGKSQVERILGSVRNVVLDWSLKLEEEGVLGEGMKFIDKEKIIAQETHITNIFHGDFTNSQLQQNSSNSSQNMNLSNGEKEEVKKLVAMINDNIEEIDFAATGRSSMDGYISDIEEALETESPQKSLVHKSLQGIIGILGGVTKSLIVSGIIYEIGLLIA